MHPAIKNALGLLLCCCSVALLCALCEFVSIERQAKPGIVATSESLVVWFDCLKNRACLTSQVLATVGSIKAASAQSYQSSRQVELAATESVAFMQDFRRDTHNVLAEVQGSIHETGLLVSDTRNRLNALLDDADLAMKSGNQVLSSANETLKPLKATLDNIDRLTKIAADQLEAGSPLVQKTFGDLDRAIGDFATLLEDKNIQATLANVAGTSGHLNGAAESIDIAMRPWRERASMLKTILSKALGMVKFTVPFF